MTEEHSREFLPEVTEALEAFESRLISGQPTVEQTAQALYKAGEPDLARQYLTYYNNAEAMNGLHLGEALSQSIELGRRCSTASDNHPVRPSQIPFAAERRRKVSPEDGVRSNTKFERRLWA